MPETPESPQNLTPQQTLALERDALMRLAYGLPVNSSSEVFTPANVSPGQADALGKYVLAQDTAENPRGTTLPTTFNGPNVGRAEPLPRQARPNLSGIRTAERDFDGHLGGGAPGNPIRVSGAVHAYPQKETEHHGEGHRS
jgi:hypothetical protein